MSHSRACKPTRLPHSRRENRGRALPPHDLARPRRTTAPPLRVCATVRLCGAATTGTRRTCGIGLCSRDRPPARAASRRLRSGFRPCCALPGRRLRPGQGRANRQRHRCPEMGTPAVPTRALNHHERRLIHLPTKQATASNSSLRSSLDADACPLRSPPRHTHEDSGSVVVSLRRPPPRTSCVGTAPATGLLASARPETSRGPISPSNPTRGIMPCQPRGPAARNRIQHRPERPRPGRIVRRLIRTAPATRRPFARKDSSRIRHSAHDRARSLK